MRAFFAVLLVSLLAGGCASAPAYIIGVDGTSVTAAEVPLATPVDIFIATTRARSDDNRVLYSGERSDTVSFAKVTVSVPPDHKTGHIERSRSLPPDPRKDFVVLNPQEFSGAAAFTAEIDEALVQRAEPDQTILLFIHGYNNDMASAILRTAQFVHDSDFRGIPVVFSWASRGKTIDYVYDLNSALHARDGIIEASRALSETRAKGFDILAHSMGNLLTIEAIRQSAIMGDYARGSRVRHVILAAPDIDIDLFRRQLAHIPLADPPIYVLTSGDDRALALSRRLAGGVSRVGIADPDELAELGVTVIDLSKADNQGSSDHTKFANSPDVVKLIGAGLNTTGSAQSPRRLRDRSIRTIAPGAVLIPARADRVQP